MTLRRVEREHDVEQFLVDEAERMGGRVRDKDATPRRPRGATQ